MTQQATFTATIPAPIEEVFELLTTPAHIPQWLPGCKGVEPDKPLRRGSKLRVSFGARSAEFEIIDIAPPHNLGWIERRGRVGHQVHFHLGFGGGSTRLAMKSVWQAKGLKAWFQGLWLRRRDAKRLFDGTVNNLRRMVTN